MKRHTIVAVAIIIGVLALAGMFMSPSGIPQTTATIVAAEESAPGTASLRAVIDPETGELAMGMVPAGEEALDADTQNALRRDSEGLVQVRHADGSVSMDLQGRFQNVSVARKNADGTVTVCADNAPAVQQALDSKTPVNAVPEVK
jgi:hypothetical protein